MTDRELESKITDCLREYYNSREFKSLWKFAEGRRKNFRAPTGFFRRSRHVFKDGTVLHVLFYKNYYRNQNGGRTADISNVWFFEVMEPDSGKIGYIMPIFYTVGNKFILFTTHCCSRMKERAGKDFFDIMIETGSIFVVKTNTKVENGAEMIMGDNQYHAFGVENDNFLTVTTFVTNDMLFSNQEALSEEMRKDYEEYVNSLYAA